MDSTSYLNVKLTVDGSTAKSVGAQVIIKAGDNIQSSEIGITRGFQSSLAPVAHFGLGEIKRVRYPKGGLA